MARGQERLEKALDTRSVIKLHRVFKSYLKLKLSQSAIILLGHQREDIVLDELQKGSASDEDLGRLQP